MRKMDGFSPTPLLLSAHGGVIRAPPVLTCQSCSLPRPSPRRLSGKAHLALRVEDTERTQCGSWGGNPRAAQDVTARTRAICQTLPFIGGIPYIFQVDFLNMTIHECYTDTPETAFSRQISDFCLLADLGTLRRQVAALLPGVSPP